LPAVDLRQRVPDCAKASRSERGEGNTHPTVKPQALMRYLVKLITPPGGLVMDPFVGSGTTGIAAIREGFRFVGIEQSAEYAVLAEKRIKSATELPIEAVV
jgi:DNA modification methylase